MPWGDEWPIAAKTLGTMKRLKGIDCEDDDHLPLFESARSEDDIAEDNADVMWRVIENMAKRRKVE